MITQVPQTHTQNISSINQTKMQSNKHKSYTAKFTRSTVKAACSAEIKKFAHVKGDILRRYWNTSTKPFDYIIDNILVTKC